VGTRGTDASRVEGERNPVEESPFLLNGTYLFGGDVPMREVAATQSPLVGLGLRMFGRRIFPTSPFEEALFLPLARQFRDALDMALVLLGGIKELATIESALDEGFEPAARAASWLRRRRRA
jgi:4,4'-dithiodibutanoate disulfide reductase